MQPTILLYAALCFVWLVMAVLIAMGYHKRFLGNAGEMAQFIAIGLCVLMMLWNIVRIMKVRSRLQRQARPNPPERDEP
jgi:hypothetical protein